MLLTSCTPFCRQDIVMHGCTSTSHILQQELPLKGFLIISQQLVYLSNFWLPIQCIYCMRAFGCYNYNGELLLIDSGRSASAFITTSGLKQACLTLLEKSRFHSRLLKFFVFDSVTEKFALGKLP